ncbi:MAG: SRPBCC family protein [Ilumatobacter sp.]|nr:SRPBCC family protein [Ilumatobacter sp.]
MAEQIVNEFTVNRPIDEAWPIICDVERIAPCLPGAQLEEIEGDVYRGRVKVKLGAVTTQFKGEAKFVERDDEAHTAKLHGKGRDTGGRGNAEADIHAVAESLSPTSTKCTVTADLHITGKVAQFGRGIMGDVSKKLMDQFADNLNTMLDEQEGPAAGSSDDTDAVPADAAESNGDSSAAGAPTDATDDASAPTVRKIHGPAAEPIDMADMAGAAVLKRAAPVIVLVLLALLLLRRRR